MEYGINNYIKYTTLQIISILVKGNKVENDENGTDANPLGGMGNGLERAYSKDDFITAVKIPEK